MQVASTSRRTDGLPENVPCLCRVQEVQPLAQPSTGGSHTLVLRQDDENS